MDHTPHNYLLITGMARSGTTLLAKILDAHPRIKIFSQPFPYLYRFLKNQFYNHLNLPHDYYVLGNLFKETRYTKEDFLKFLETFKIDIENLKQILKDMEGWSGQQTEIENIDGFIKNIKEATLDAIYKQLIDKLNTNKEITTLGSKEILIEEYIPYYLSKGIKVILITRDPRDVFTSLNYGKGPDYIGKHRPALFHLRNWRKSIAIANTYLKHPNFLAVRYEDVLVEKEKILSKITHFMDIEPFPDMDFKNGFKTSEGTTWQANSSTHNITGLDSTNFNKYKKLLSNKTIQYIEYICEPEMKTWGYRLETNKKLSKFDIADFKEPYQVNVNDLDPLMSSERKNLDDEEERRQLLEKKTLGSKTMNLYFYSAENFKLLKNNTC